MENNINYSMADAYVAGSIPVDRINELYRGEIFTEETADIARERIHWMCAQCRGGRVLDVGCSQGIASILLAREGFNVTAIDTHPLSVDFARREFAAEVPQVQQRLTLIETDLDSLPNEQRYDSILLGEVIEHQVHPYRLLQAAKSRLFPGGRLIITTPFALHPHPDHKVSLFPSNLSQFARDLGMAVTNMWVDGNYMRCVFVESLDTGAFQSDADLLRMTESATLSSQQRLYSRLKDCTDRLKKQADALRISKGKITEATGLIEANAQRHDSELNALRILHQEEVAALRAEMEQAKQQAEMDLALAKATGLQDLQLAKAEYDLSYKKLHAQLQSAQAEINSTKLGLENEIDRLRNYNGRLKLRIEEARSSLNSIKSSARYRLGRALVRGFKSPGAMFGLPSQLWSLWREARENRQSRDQLINYPDKVDALQMDNAPQSKHVNSRSTAEPVKATPIKPGYDVDTLKMRIEAEGLAVVKAELLAAQSCIKSNDIAFLMLQLGKALANDGRLDDEFNLAKAAVELDGSEQTLRGFFWAAERSRKYDQSCWAVLQLKRIFGGTPTPAQKAILLKLQGKPAFQLSVLDLVVKWPDERIESVSGRVCYVLHNSLPYSSGGYGTRSHGVAGGLIAAGREVFVLTRPGFPLDIKPELNSNDVPAEDVIDGVRYLRTLEPKRKGMSMVEYVTSAADALEQRMRLLRPEIVIAASNHLVALPALIAARRLGIPFVYEVRGFWEVTRISREPDYEETSAFAVQSQLEAATAKLADHVFTLTGPMREELESRGVPSAKIELLPNSCNPERFLPRPRDDALAARLGIPDNVPVIGYIGTFVEYEGLDDLARACALLKRRGLLFRLMLVGNENTSGTERGPITEQILTIGNAEGMMDWLIMPGRVPHEEVEGYYSLIDIAPFPRKPLPVCEMVSPMKPLEALAMEKAVIVSSVRALTEMIEDGQTGVVFEKGSVTSLADRLQELIDAPERRAELGRRGRSWVSAERTWNQIGVRATHRFDQVLQAHRERGTEALA